MDDPKQQLSLFRTLSLVLAGVVIGGLITLFVSEPFSAEPADSFDSQQSKVSYAAVSGDSQEAQGPPSSSDYWVVQLAEQSLPFVVNIQTTSNPAESGQQNGSGQGRSSPDYEQFEDEEQDGQQQQQQNPQSPFDLFPFPQRPQGQQGPQQPMPRGEGSGFIISEDGYIVTNFHVISQGNEYTVTLHDGTELKAERVGADPLKDVAVLKVDADRDLPYAPLGDSSSIKVGEPAVAIGSPFGLQHTVTAGIVSAVGRSPEEVRAPRAGDPRGISNLIQTDASINRGNSGGPLLNSDGKVIGINEAIIPNADRIGFAIAINDVKSTIQNLKQGGDAQYPGLGVTIISLDQLSRVNPELAQQIGVDQGIFIQSVRKGGAADHAGLNAQDVIVSVDGEQVTSNQQIIKLLTEHEVGDMVNVVVARGGDPDNQEEVAVQLQALNVESFTRQRQQRQRIPIPTP